MKRKLVLAGLLLLSSFLQPLYSMTFSASHPVSANYTDSLAANAMMLRINEIKETDRTTLNHAEKKALRKELRSLKKQVNSNGKGIYLSIGAIIIIILLLILIL